MELPPLTDSELDFDTRRERIIKKPVHLALDASVVLSPYDCEDSADDEARWRQHANDTRHRGMTAQDKLDAYGYYEEHQGEEALLAPAASRDDEDDVASIQSGCGECRRACPHR